MLEAQGGMATPEVMQGSLAFPLPRTHSSSARGYCRSSHPGHHLPPGWLSPSSPSLWNQEIAH